MRLIDADELKKECRSVPDPKGRYSELRIIEDYEIDDAPTIFEIPDNATNGDVIKAIFPNLEIKEIGTNGGLQEPYEYRCDNREDLMFRALAKWWNSPYK